MVREDSVRGPTGRLNSGECPSRQRRPISRMPTSCLFSASRGRHTLPARPEQITNTPELALRRSSLPLVGGGAMARPTRWNKLDELRRRIDDVLVRELLEPGLRVTLAAAQHVLYGWVGAWSEPAEVLLPDLNGVQVAVGNPGRGIDGFRHPHVQARLVRRPRGCAVEKDPASSAIGIATWRRCWSRTSPEQRPSLSAGRIVRLLQTITIYHEEGLSCSTRAARPTVDPLDSAPRLSPRRRRSNSPE